MVDSEYSHGILFANIAANYERGTYGKGQYDWTGISPPAYRRFSCYLLRSRYCISGFLCDAGNRCISHCAVCGISAEQKSEF